MVKILISIMQSISRYFNQRAGWRNSWHQIYWHFNWILYRRNVTTETIVNISLYNNIVIYIFVFFFPSYILVFALNGTKLCHIKMTQAVKGATYYIYFHYKINWYNIWEFYVQLMQCYLFVGFYLVTLHALTGENLFEIPVYIVNVWF